MRKPCIANKSLFYYILWKLDSWSNLPWKYLRHCSIIKSMSIYKNTGILITKITIYIFFFSRAGRNCRERTLVRVKKSRSLRGKLQRVCGSTECMYIRTRQDNLITSSHRTTLINMRRLEEYERLLCNAWTIQRNAIYTIHAVLSTIFLLKSFPR